MYVHLARYSIEINFSQRSRNCCLCRASTYKVPYQSSQAFGAEPALQCLDSLFFSLLFFPTISWTSVALLFSVWGWWKCGALALFLAHTHTHTHTHTRTQTIWVSHSREWNWMGGYTLAWQQACPLKCALTQTHTFPSSVGWLTAAQPSVESAVVSMCMSLHDSASLWKDKSQHLCFSS